VGHPDNGPKLKVEQYLVRDSVAAHSAALHVGSHGPAAKICTLFTATAPSDMSQKNSFPWPGSIERQPQANVNGQAEIAPRFCAP